jgi:hypothetical protein
MNGELKEDSFAIEVLMGSAGSALVQGCQGNLVLASQGQSLCVAVLLVLRCVKAGVKITIMINNKLQEELRGWKEWKERESGRSLRQVRYLIKVKIRYRGTLGWLIQTRRRVEKQRQTSFVQYW